jgi:4-amino-4-deoxy-L-arabinose transferase-like glycosyltransferase
VSEIAGRGKYLSDAARAVWLGPIAFAVAVTGTELLNHEHLRLLAVLLLVTAGVLAIVAWSDSPWLAAFPPNRKDRIAAAQLFLRRRKLALAVLASAVVSSTASHIAFLTAPRVTFGLAGLLWLASIGLILAAARLFDRADSARNSDQSAGLPAWSWWEAAVVASLAILALALRVWDLRNVPFNIYPDEVMTGVVAERAYLNGPTAAPLFSTLWSDIELPALWFAIVAATLKVGGIGLAVVRLPAALFGAATVLPLYALLRNVWGRVAATAGATLMAFSAANVHYSRMALNNITTPFFWAACFFFIVRGLRRRSLTDWTLAGLAAGVSEHFYYGTRLLPFILIAFVVYLFVVHWAETRDYIAHIGALVLGYLIGFGPLLSYFVTHRGLYYGRGAGLMTWNHIPTNWEDLQKMWNTLWPIMSENLLGISTSSAQDIMYFAPLLLVAEAALLLLGVALLVWRWRHPAAFLLLLSGLAVLLVGGTLVLYPNSSPPMLAHWTPAFPFFYAAIAVPVGAWAVSAHRSLASRGNWITCAVMLLGLVTLAYANIHFYFFRYYANPESLRSERYKAAQRLYEVQTIQSRYMASLGTGYRIIVAGRSPYPYDPESTRYLVNGQEYTPSYNPEAESLTPIPGKGIAFLFFPGDEQYQEKIRERYPGGKANEVHNPVGRHVFYAYVVAPEIIRTQSQAP